MLYEVITWLKIVIKYINASKHDGPTEPKSIAPHSSSVEAGPSMQNLCDVQLSEPFWPLGYRAAGLVNYQAKTSNIHRVQLFKGGFAAFLLLCIWRLWGLVLLVIYRVYQYIELILFIGIFAFAQYIKSGHGENRVITTCTKTLLSVKKLCWWWQATVALESRKPRKLSCEHMFFAHHTRASLNKCILSFILMVYPVSTDPIG